MPHRWIRKQGSNLLKLKDSSASIARGVALGTFFGFVPLIGFKTLLSMGSAKLFRGNVVASVIAVTLHDIILPLAPLILKWEYDIGRMLLGRRPLPGSPKGHGHLDLAQLWHWSAFERFGLPLMVGALAIGLPCGIAAYFGTKVAVERARARRAAAEAAGELPAEEAGEGDSEARAAEHEEEFPMLPDAEALTRQQERLRLPDGLDKGA